MKKYPPHRGPNSLEKMVKAVEEYENTDQTRAEIAEKYNIGVKTLYNWRKKYQEGGIDALTTNISNAKYSKELKLKAVEDYLSGRYSLSEVVKKYNLSTIKLVYNWVKIYNNHRKLKSTPEIRSNKTMTKKITYDLKIKTVLFCIANDYEYGYAAEKFDVSIYEVKSWIKAYEKDGREALMNPIEKKKIKQSKIDKNMAKKLKKLGKENERLKADNAFLKKLEELERRGI